MTRSSSASSGHYTPLSYPGGKGKLAAYLKQIIRANKLFDSEYVEPFAGGAAVALELLFEEYVAKVYINDISRPIHAFWSAVLFETDELCRRVRDAPLTVEFWDRQKRIFMEHEKHGDLDVGFAAFFLNRTNRSGILNGGIIGGRLQDGPWKMDARYNSSELARRVERIASMRKRIELSREDAAEFLVSRCDGWGVQTLVYLDPPYFKKGSQLYFDYFKRADHEHLAQVVRTQLNRCRWLVSYDYAPEICEMYEGLSNIVYSIGYSARDARQGTEIMFFGPNLNVPELVGPLSETSRSA